MKQVLKYNNRDLRSPGVHLFGKGVARINEAERKAAQVGGHGMYVVDHRICTRWSLDKQTVREWSPRFKSANRPLVMGARRVLGPLQSTHARLTIAEDFSSFCAGGPLLEVFRTRLLVFVASFRKYVSPHPVMDNKSMHLSAAARIPASRSVARFTVASRNSHRYAIVYCCLSLMFTGMRWERARG